MWGSVLVVAVLAALNPVRLGLLLLVISRPRPVQNLLAFSAGCVAGCVPFLVIPLVLVHFTPISDQIAQGWTTSPTARHLQIGAGICALSIACIITVRALIRRRNQAQLLAAGSNASSPVLESAAPTALPKFLHREHASATTGGSVFRRLLRRVHDGWWNGSVWVAFVIGLAFGGPQPDAALFVVTLILASGASFASQAIAVLVFIVGMLALEELALISFLIAPAKTHKLVGAIHAWTWTHRRKILVAILTVVGFTLVSFGMGAI